MKVIEFDIKKGMYRFELSAFSTIFHAHPAVEIISVDIGSLSIETSEQVYHNVTFAIIDANIQHRVILENGVVDIMMVESPIQSLLEKFEIVLSKGLFIEKDRKKYAHVIEHLVKEKYVFKTMDWRIQECLSFFDRERLSYYEMMKILKTKIHLSESRISHLFKEEMGISLKKYLVWTRLKQALQSVIEDKISLYDAALQSGFYDQAHLSKTFKQMLGIPPSAVYNSRMIQE